MDIHDYLPVSMKKSENTVVYESQDFRAEW